LPTAPGQSEELKRHNVMHLCEKLNTSETHTCNVLGVECSIMTFESKNRVEDALMHDIIKLVNMYRWNGYRKIVPFLRIAGWKVNHNTVERIWREER